MPEQIILSMHPGAARVLVCKTAFGTVRIERQGFPER